MDPAVTSGPPPQAGGLPPALWATARVTWNPAHGEWEAPHVEVAGVPLYDSAVTFCGTYPRRFLGWDRKVHGEKGIVLRLWHGYPGDRPDRSDREFTTTVTPMGRTKCLHCRRKHKSYFYKVQVGARGKVYLNGWTGKILEQISDDPQVPAQGSWCARRRRIENLWRDVWFSWEFPEGTEPAKRRAKRPSEVKRADPA